MNIFLQNLGLSSRFLILESIANEPKESFAFLFLYPSSPCFVACLYTGIPFWVLHDFLCAKLASPDDIGKYRDAISGESSNGCSANFLLKFLAVVILWGLLFIAQRKVYTR